jgi:methylmalonyl-CoA/ethylmalonyl-CoA epimerase
VQPESRTAAAWLHPGAGRVSAAAELNAPVGIRFDHIALAQRRIEDAAAFLTDALGGVRDYGRLSGSYRWAQWRFAGGGRLELLEPAGADGFLHRFLARQGPGVHHVTFRVPSLSEACRRATRHGYQIVGYDDSDPRWKEAFLHPKQALGIVVQLAEPGPEKAPRPRPAPPPETAVRIVGLRLRAHAPERADTQWRDVLGATRPGAAGDLLKYRWPESAMAITVEIDPLHEEGPVAIEIAGRGAHALVGAECPPGMTFSLV